MDKDIVYALSDKGIRIPRTSAVRPRRSVRASPRFDEVKRDERTGMNEPLVCRLSRQGHRRVAMFGSDKR